MEITFFTPTYNRAYILPRLYQSLKNQKTHNFEWLIVDDGSTDHTESAVNEFIAEADFSIRYYKQSNQGKHIAINFAALNAAGKWIIIIDSDDYVIDNCLQVCKSLISDIENKKGFAGFTFIRTSENECLNIEDYGFKKWSTNKDYDWKFPGEMNFVIKKEILQRYPFPVIKGENFCQESVQIIPIIKKYKILYTDHILAFGDYLEDGLSQNLYARLLKNPRYAMLSFKTKLQMSETIADKKILAQNYWDIALKTNQPNIKSFLQFPVLLSMPFLGRKLLTSLRKGI